MLNLTKSFFSAIICDRHVKLEEIKMFYDETQAIMACEEEPSLIFELVKEEHYNIVDLLLSKNKVDINISDEAGNNILVRLLKSAKYDLVLKHMKNKNWDVNHQNNDGDTFAHILVQDRGLKALDIIKALKKNKSYVPNIKNNFGETILDKAIESNYISNTINILEDKRFNNIGLASFNDLYHTYIKSEEYGKYSRLNTLEVVVNNLQDKELVPSLKTLIQSIVENFDLIKKEFFHNETNILDELLNTTIRSLA